MYKFCAVILAFVIGILAVAGWLYYQESQKVRVILPQAKWESIFYKSIKQATNLGGLAELRKTNLKDGDIEIRVWHEANDLEGVILKRSDGQWSGLHLKADDFTEIKEVNLNELNPPKSGWDAFWKQLTDKGILTIYKPSVKECDSSFIDGTDYIVEINQNKTYLIYKYPTGGSCAEAKRMEEIGDIIGEEFASGSEKCRGTEWFSCTKLRQANK